LQILDNKDAPAHWEMLRHGEENYEELELEIVGRLVEPVPTYIHPLPSFSTQFYFLPLFKTVAKNS
jgi:hypothetical protein